jgi:hypothetical protein
MNFVIGVFSFDVEESGQDLVNVLLIVHFSQAFVKI